ADHCGRRWHCLVHRSDGGRHGRWGVHGLKTRRAIAIVFSALTFAGCSKAVVIPREDLGNEKYRNIGSYRIKLHGWNEYHARRFSMTDSTVVIEELLVSDDRYKLKRHDMPIVLPVKDIESIAEMKNDPVVTTSVLLGVGVFAAFCIWLSTIDLSFE